MSRSLRRLAAAALLLCMPPAFNQAAAAEPFTYVTDWYAQAEHGGYYQALAEGIYRRHGLDVTIRMGGPQVNIIQLMAAGQADCIMGSSDIQIMQARASGVPIKTVAAFFQKNPSVLVAHDDVKSPADLPGKTILISASANRSYWPWLKAKYGLNDNQTRPYTFNIQPFVADANTVQQGYLTSEPFAIAKAGVANTVLLLADYGYPAYANLVSCMDATIASRHAQVGAFIEATAAGWKSYLANPAPGNALIKAENPKITDEQLAYSLAKLKESAMVMGGDAATIGIGALTAAREKATYDFLVDGNLLDPAKLDVHAAYDLSFMPTAKPAP